MSELKELQDAFGELRKSVESFKETQTKAETERKEHGDITALTDGKIQAILDDMEKYDATIAELQAKMDKPRMDGKDKDEANEKLKSAFDDYCRKGFITMGAENLETLKGHQQELVTKGLTESVNPTAGFLVRPEMANEIIKSVNEVSPIRGIAKVVTIGSMAWEGPKRTGQFSASWVSETGTRAETTGLTYGIERIPVHELSAMVPVSHALLEDSFVNIEAELNGEFVEQFALAEGTAFVTGTTTGRPEGFTINPATVANATTSGTNDALEADDFSELFIGQLKEPYHANSTWVMHRTTLRDAMQLKDGNQQYIWQPGLAAGIPQTILGRPYILATDMPTVADAALALAIGDFKRGYQIVDRIGINVQRVEDTVTIDEGGVRFYARRRVGGQVINQEAIRLLKIQ